jgi:hypothetical protein
MVVGARLRRREVVDLREAEVGKIRLLCVPR